MATDADDRSLRKARLDALPPRRACPGLHLPLLPRPPRHPAQDLALRDGARGSSQVDFTWEWSNSSKAFTDFGEHLWRALGYAGVTTIICILLAYPLAYFIAFKVGRWRNLLLGLVMVPFFTSFLLRTIAWQSLFADNGPVLGIADTLHLIGLLDAVGITTDGKILNTPPAVIGGLVYNFLPFALLPIYVSLEKIPTNLFDAAADLYSRSPAPSEGDPADVDARRVRRHPADVHPSLRRLHQPPPPRRPPEAGHRRSHPGSIPAGR